MKKVLLFILGAIIACNSVFSQNVQLGKELDNRSFAHIPSIIYKNKDVMYVLRMTKIDPQGYKIIRENKKASLSALLLGYGRANSDESIMNLDNYFSKSNGYALEVYDNNMNMIKSYPFDVILEKAGMLSSSGNKSILLKKIFYLNDKITFFSTLYDSKLKQITVGYHFLSNEGDLDKDLKPLWEVKVKDDDLEEEIGFSLSPDQSKVVLYCPLESDSKTTPPGIFVKVINTSDYSTDWESKFFFQDKEVELEKVLLNNKGETFVLTKNQLEGQEREKSSQKYRYMLYSCKKGNKIPGDFNLKIGDQFFLNNMLVKFDNKGNILASGFYSEKSANFAKGAFVVKLDASTGSPLINALIPFVNEVSEGKDESDKEKAFFHMRDIGFLNDASIVLIGEQYYIDISNSRYGYGMAGSTSFSYRYKDILVMTLAPDGKMKWMKGIPKKQYTGNDGAMYSSFVSMILNNKISLIVNGHKDGLDKRLSGFTDNNIVYLLEFDAKGNMVKKSLYSGEEAETRLSPKVSYKVNDQEIILYNIRASGKYRFARVNF